MNKRPTPETDAEHAQFRMGGFTLDFCRKLERERDESREEIEHMKSLLLDPHAVHINFLHGKIAKLDWEKLEHIHGPHPARKERDEAREDAANYYAKIGELIEERDLARKEIDRYREKHDLLPISWEL